MARAAATRAKAAAGVAKAAADSNFSTPEDTGPAYSQMKLQHRSRPLGNSQAKFSFRIYLNSRLTKEIAVRSVSQKK